MAVLDSFAVAGLLEELGARLELTGDSPFKVRAYYRAAEMLRELEEPLATVVASGRLKDLPGVGEAIAEKITSLQKTGSHPTLERLRQEVPDGLLRLTRVPGLGPRRVLQLKRELGVQDLGGLEAALAAGRVAPLKGFGPRLQARLVEAAAFVRRAAERLLLPEADALLDAVHEELRRRPGVLETCTAGEARRRCETIVTPSVVAASAVPQDLPAALGPDGAVRVIAVSPEQYGVTLLYETGSPEHLAALEARAREAGLRLGREGLLRGDERLPASTERELYAALQLPWIEPDWREGRDEIEAATAGKLPVPLQVPDVRGLLHCHTRYSDGLSTLEETAHAARALGMGYLGVAEHSQSASYAGGLSVERIRAQHEEIGRLNARARQKEWAFTLFKGIESDIREDGSLDYPDEVLASFDFVIASVHSRFDLDQEAQTARVLKALTHPATTILGHPTGRLLRRREGLKLDVDAVLRGCAEHGVVVELNAHPERLDLDWRWHARALELGLRLSINPDAHAAGELVQYRYGVEIARKGRVPAASILNHLEAPALAEYFQSRKRR